MPKIDRDPQRASLRVGLHIGTAFGEVRKANIDWVLIEQSLKIALKNVRILLHSENK